MKLLFDQNLSHRLVALVADLFPESLHIRDAGLAKADDEAIWEYAKVEGYVIVSKDSDFRQRSFVLGAPPKAIWIHRGNLTTAQVSELLRRHQPDLVSFFSEPTTAFLEFS